MNLALYREFRPKSFDDVVGQEYIIKTLKNQIKTDRLTHAYLFCGPRGTGKTSTAKIFARAVNCTHSTDGNPCGLCAECVALSEPNTDIVEIDAASNNRVEEIRDLREKVNFPPLIGKYKVYIIDEVHMLTDSAFNALLKTLEEPPKHVIFILATTEIHKLPTTILSRCTRFDFKLLPITTLIEHLKTVFSKKQIACDEKSLYAIAKAGEGSVRDMLSIADSVASFCDYNITIEQCEKVIGLSNRDSIKNILRAIAAKDISALFMAVKSALGTGKNIQVLCKEMADFIKNLVMIKSGVGDYAVLDIMPGEFSQFAEIANQFDVGFLKSAFSKFAAIELDLKYSLNPENLFESACLSLIDTNPAQQSAPTETKPAETKLTPPTPKEVQPPTAQPQPAQTMAETPAKTDMQPVQNEPTFDEPQQSADIDRLWGNVLIKFKDYNMFALINALRSVNKVEQSGHKLILHTNDLSSFEMIDNPDRIEVILKTVKLFDDGMEAVEVVYDKEHASTQDVKDNLKQVFKTKIQFK